MHNKILVTHNVKSDNYICNGFKEVAFLRWTVCIDKNHLRNRDDLYGIEHVDPLI